MMRLHNTRDLPAPGSREFSGLHFSILFLLALTPPIHAVENIPINNHGFEANTVADGCFQVFIPTGWMVYDPNGIYDGGNDSVGGLNADEPYFPGGAPEGEHVALTFIATEVGGGPMGLRQVLGEVLEANTIYTLSVQIGNIASGQGPPPCDIFGFFNLNGFPGYQIQLLAGGVVIAEDDNSLARTIPEGEFRLSTIQAEIGDLHPQLGAVLEVRLINLNIPGPPSAPGIEVDFDDVQLVTGCPNTGDLNEDEAVDGDDVSIFVDVLLELDSDPTHIMLADLNCSGAPDGEDVQPLLDSLLN